MSKQGFTLVEILTAVVIVTILVTMAVPMYEKTIERSRMAEARTVLNRLQAAKLTAMDMMGCTTYLSTSAVCPKIKHLGVAFAQGTVAGNDYAFETKDFHYSINPGGSYPKGVCARRLGGDYAGTLFLYNGEQEDVEPLFLCHGAYCEAYGLESSNAFSACN